MALNLTGSVALAIAAILIAVFLAMLHVFAVDLQSVLYSLAYGVAVVAIPGYLLAWLTLHSFSADERRIIPRGLEVSLATLFGMLVVMACYLSAKWLELFALNFSFVLTYGVLLHPRFWSQRGRIRFSSLGVPALTTAVFVFAVGFLIFMMRPTPGILPVDIFHDHLWNVSNTVALANDFPLKSLNIETQPVLPYHILVHVVGAHLALVTGIAPHLVGLQYVFVPLTVILVLNVVAVFQLLVEQRARYVFYGTMVVFFGGGFAILHEVKVHSLINSASNLVGVIVLFAWIGIQGRAGGLSGPTRFLCAFAALFLATVAKGSIGAALAGGMTLWILFRLWKHNVSANDIAESLGVLSGFVVSYVLFFSFFAFSEDNILPALELLEGKRFAVAPLAYVTQNALASDLVYYVNKYLQGAAAVIGHLVITLVVLPFHILLYFSYRLLPFLARWQYELGDVERKVLFVALAAALIAYTVEGTAQEHAYFLFPGLYALDVVFVLWAWRISLLEKLASYRKRHLFAFLGVLFVVLLPFAGAGGWFKTEYAMNFIVYGRIGETHDEVLRNTKYRSSRNTITPSLYRALQYIRRSTAPSTVVVTPFIELKDGRPLSFWTSAFSERTAYLEGYGFLVSRAVSVTEIDERRHVVSQLYDHFVIAEGLRAANYVILASAGFVAEARSRSRLLDFKVDYENAEWSVLRVRTSRPE